LSKPKTAKQSAATMACGLRKCLLQRLLCLAAREGMAASKKRKHQGGKLAAAYRRRAERSEHRAWHRRHGSGGSGS
jgi:hypothetical protein